MSLCQVLLSVTSLSRYDRLEMNFQPLLSMSTLDQSGADLWPARECSYSKQQPESQSGACVKWPRAYASQQSLSTLEID